MSLLRCILSWLYTNKVRTKGVAETGMYAPRPPYIKTLELVASDHRRRGLGLPPLATSGGIKTKTRC